MTFPKITQAKVSDLLPYANNAREHTEEQVAQVAASIKEFGWTNPIITHGQTVVAGHARLAAARKLNLEEVPVIDRSDMSEAQWKAYVLADNQLAQNATWNEGLLTLELDALAELDFDLDLLGFPDLDALMDNDEPEEGLTDPDEVPEPPADPITQLGDLWILGDHRLLCGDSTDPECVAYLMDGAKADMCFTSPPYALGKAVLLRGNGKSNAYQSHSDNPEEWEDLMRGWWDSSQDAVSDVWVVNIQPLAGNKVNLMKWIAERVGRLVDIATWVKKIAPPHIQQGVMASKYEWLIIMGSDNASRVVPLSSWQGTVQSVYEGDGQHHNEYTDTHLATMPTHLPLWVMQTLCDQSKSVYEPFAGTGTTLIAAQQLGRKCYGMEIDPIYCDVIVKRWEDFTGQKAERHGGTE